MHHTDTLLNRQRAYLLQQLAQAPEGTLTASVANKQIPAGFKKSLGLNAKESSRIRVELEREGKLLTTKVGRILKLENTPGGQDLLLELKEFLPAPVPNKEPKPKKAVVSLDGPDRLLREAYILDAFARAANQSISKVDLERGWGGKPKLKELEARYPVVVPFRSQACFDLRAGTARLALAALVEQGSIQKVGTGDAESYSISTAGLEQLKSLRVKYPILPPTGKPAVAPNSDLREMWDVFVLLKLLEAPEQRANSAQAYQVKYPSGSKLNHATAWVLRQELTSRGYIKVHRTGEDGLYTLTPEGLRYLAGLSFNWFEKLEIKGPAITTLLFAARGAATSQPSVNSPAAVVPSTAALEAGVMEIFHELLRERYSNDSRVPIHEVRRTITNRFGPEAASHKVFDGILLGLDRKGMVRLVSIDDRSRATSQQLQDSIAASEGTLFHIKRIGNVT